MVIQRVCGFLVLGVILGLASCSGKPTPPDVKRVPVVPVKGTVTVDGSPQAGIVVRCIPVGQFNHPGLAPETLGGKTNDQGEFTLDTYESGDGIPEGEYSLTFIWPPGSLKKSSKTEELKADRLKGKYATAKTSPQKITVESGAPLVLDPIELKTK